MWLFLQCLRRVAPKLEWPRRDEAIFIVADLNPSASLFRLCCCLGLNQMDWGCCRTGWNWYCCCRTGLYLWCRWYHWCRSRFRCPRPSCQPAASGPQLGCRQTPIGCSESAFCSRAGKPWYLECPRLQSAPLRQAANWHLRWKKSPATRLQRLQLQPKLESWAPMRLP